MTSLSRLVSAACGAALLAGSVSAVLLAQAPALDVKMGLWEISSTTEIGGKMPNMPDTSKMTPEQRTQMEAAMKAMMGSHTNVAKSCITKEKFDKSNFMDPGDPDMACRQAITTNTRSALDANVTCTGDHSMSAQMHVDAMSPTSFKAVLKSTSTEQGNTMTMNITMAGKWLGADCGKTE